MHVVVLVRDTNLLRFLVSSRRCSTALFPVFGVYFNGIFLVPFALSYCLSVGNNPARCIARCVSCFVSSVLGLLLEASASLSF